MNIAARIIWLFVACTCLTGTALAQNYPNRAIRVIVPQQPGDPCDTFARLLGPYMTKNLGQQLVVDNRPGAGGMIGLELAATAPADGYTIACGQGGNLSVIPHTMKNVPYKALQDFAPVALVATNYLALVAANNAPFKTTAELVKHLKANPGKVTFATNGQGAFLHMATELFRSYVGFEYIHVPFKGIGSMAQELLANRVDAAFSSFTAIQPFVKAGQVRLLGIAKETRAPNYPDLPTVAESVPGFSSGGWFGFVAPAKVPKEVITVLNREMNLALKQPEVRAKLESLGLDVRTESPEYLRDLMKSEYNKYGKVARDIKLVPQ
ncbi:MAG: tripartite tricarboxylate transporter substrate binding protein [Burkholderiales bacterium]|jgi:tripartite-type tricarboxylate transporter receptor subunit TctC|nr:tripartite tricarboxylate transporter substrate binding protein [Burkholderiales bacterium]